MLDCARGLSEEVYFFWPGTEALVTWRRGAGFDDALKDDEEVEPKREVSNPIQSCTES